MVHIRVVHQELDKVNCISLLNMWFLMGRDKMIQKLIHLFENIGKGWLTMRKKHCEHVYGMQHYTAKRFVFFTQTNNVARVI